MSYDYLFKYVIVGETGVGKSAFSDRYVDNKFVYNYEPTLGVDFKTKSIILEDHTVIKTHLWDTAGHEKFAPIIKHYYKGVAGIILMYDVTNRGSFAKLQYWLNKINDLKDKYVYIPIILIGNKIDASHRNIDGNVAKQFALKNGLLYSECSAKTGENVMESFKVLTKEIYSQIDASKPVNNPGIKRHFSFNENDCLTRECSSKRLISRMCCTII
jgi:small GTP-binding protein